MICACTHFNRNVSASHLSILPLQPWLYVQSFVCPCQWLCSRSYVFMCRLHLIQLSSIKIRAYLILSYLRARMCVCACVFVRRWARWGDGGSGRNFGPDGAKKTQGIITGRPKVWRPSGSSAPLCHKPCWCWPEMRLVFARISHLKIATS